MTITSFDNGIPIQFYKEQSLQGRLMIFMRYVGCKVMRRDLIGKDLNKLSIMMRVDDPLNAELYFDGALIGYIKLLKQTKDFIFKQ